MRNLQEALARAFDYELSLGFDNPKCYFNSIAHELLPKRDRMAAIARGAGLDPLVPQSGYFMLVDYTRTGVPSVKLGGVLYLIIFMR